ncbi:hypothetical protein HDG34_005887 [Paraburkholderia sp. HC6.4b]|uniref:phage minor head protein n=1 Tax=unclassified Paraburkholderia TaxID=2615204 RepID=UPI0016196533|nr:MULTISPECIES: phage minor head protein [unclassified Paraburkholderia]MBB5411921.1 hypothetical protein [Paraburkholderia sp. HC6.4b]MBB5450233.1 hypothetical protein [Paraburkholderia sp. Kb1A]
MSRDPYPDLARKYDLQIQRALMDSWDALRGMVSENDLARILATEGVSGIYRLLDQFNITISQRLMPVMQAAMIESGRVAIAIIPSSAVTTPAYITAMPRSASVDAVIAERIDQISVESASAVRQAVDTAMSAGRPPLEIARDFRESIGLTTQQESFVANYRTNLENLDRNALLRALRDKRSDSSIERAIAENAPLSKERIDKLVSQYRSRWIKYRSQVIARTESLTAVSVAQDEAIGKAIADGHISPNIIKRWVTTEDGRERPVHEELHGDEVRFGEYFSNSLGRLRYPRDPDGSAENVIQCRCRVQYVLPKS